MLRNRVLPQVWASGLGQRYKSGGGSGSGSTNATRQSKILGKLFGNRVAGSKKRWYPSGDVGNGGASNASGSYMPASVIFQASQFGKGSNSVGSKQNTRRMSVLNKLFMTHITDLLATGESVEGVQGHGLQVTRVRISSDFSCINVYWLGRGEATNDAALELELQRCSGQLRHELSQLRLMGEVPRLRFVRDKTGSNLNHVEGILRNLNLQEEQPEQSKLEGVEGQQEQLAHTRYDLAQTARQEFYGQLAMPGTLPPMRHDVLGLDHRLVLDKILGKMRKSKLAWEQHQQHQQLAQQTPLSSTATPWSPPPSSENNRFESFLAKRRERKQTPERKRHERHELDFSAPDYEDLQLESSTQQEDYIVEEESRRKP